MAYIALGLMRYTTPEITYAIMVNWFEHHDAKEMFLPGFPGLKKNFYILLSLQKKYMPALYAKFREVNYIPQWYAAEWFLTLFSKFP